MCIISILPKGKVKNSEEVTTFIKNGFNNNKDGSGFMYKRAGSKDVIISKGHHDIEALLADIRDANLTDDDELVVHHRIGNVGLKNDANTHPFVCGGDEKELEKVHAKFNKPCLVHNGTFSSIQEFKKLNPDNSDTYAFARYVVGNKYVQSLLKTDQYLFEYLLYDIINKGKICFLFPDRDLIKIGEFIEVDGYFHSNDGFREDWYRDVGGVLKKKPAPPAVFPSRKNGGGRVSSANNLDYITDYKQRLSLMLLRPSLTLDGNMIRITQFNHKNFLFSYKNPNHMDYERVFKSISFDELAIYNPFVSTSSGKCMMTIYLNDHTLNTEMEYILNSEHVESYKEYVILQRDLEVSRQAMKKLYTQLKNSRFKTLDYKLFNKKTKMWFSRMALIEYYNYYKEDIMKDPNELNMSSILADETTYIRTFKDHCPVLCPKDEQEEQEEQLVDLIV